MLINDFLPTSDVTEIRLIEVDAPPDLTWSAIREADLRDGLIRALFTLRELPERVARRWRGEPAPARGGPVTFGSMVEGGPGFTHLGEDPGREFVVGSVGKFWRKNYGGRPIAAGEFKDFREPGFAKLALSFAVQPSLSGGTVLRYEARTATTDPSAERAFRRYWRLIRPGVVLVMDSALRRIKEEAEHRAEEALCPVS